MPDTAPMQPGATFFQNRACPHFPCHEGVPEQDFNCLFCYCPLYALGPDCGGRFAYTPKGVKSCMGCNLPHVRDDGARMVAERYGRIAALAGRPADPPSADGVAAGPPSPSED